MQGNGSGFKLTLRDRIELERRQKLYQALVRDFVAEVFSIIGEVEDPQLSRRAKQELATEVADTIAGFIARHS